MAHFEFKFVDKLCMLCRRKRTFSDIYLITFHSKWIWLKTNFVKQKSFITKKFIQQPRNIWAGLNMAVGCLVWYKSCNPYPYCSFRVTQVLSFAVIVRFCYTKFGVYITTQKVLVWYKSYNWYLYHQMFYAQFCRYSVFLDFF